MRHAHGRPTTRLLQRFKTCFKMLRHFSDVHPNRKSCRRPVVSLSHETKIVPCKSALTHWKYRSSRPHIAHAVKYICGCRWKGRVISLFNFIAHTVCYKWFCLVHGLDISLLAGILDSYVTWVNLFFFCHVSNRHAWRTWQAKELPDIPRHYCRANYRDSVTEI